MRKTQYEDLCLRIPSLLLLWAALDQAYATISQLDAGPKEKL